MLRYAQHEMKFGFFSGLCRSTVCVKRLKVGLVPDGLDMLIHVLFLLKTGFSGRVR